MSSPIALISPIYIMGNYAGFYQIIDTIEFCLIIMEYPPRQNQTNPAAYRVVYPPSAVTPGA